MHAAGRLHGRREAGATVGAYPQVMNTAAPGPALTTELPAPTPPQRQWLVGRVWHSLVRRTGWLVVPFAGRRLVPLWVVIRHAGRTSGRSYATPVVARRNGDGYVIPLPFGPHTQWAKNVIAAGSAELAVRGHRYVVDEPRIVEGPDGLAMFNAIERRIVRLFGMRSVLVVRRARRLD